MTTYLPDAEQGCLLLADITGYTDYLQGSELEHAQDVLADLLETVIAGVEPRFTVSKLEGDAVLAYLPADDVDMSVLLDTIEATYVSFRPGSATSSTPPHVTATHASSSQASTSSSLRILVRMSPDGSAAPKN
jgi:class 3 adenylate cyclase